MTDWLGLVTSKIHIKVDMKNHIIDLEVAKESVKSPVPIGYLATLRLKTFSTALDGAIQIGNICYSPEDVLIEIEKIESDLEEIRRTLHANFK